MGHAQKMLSYMRDDQAYLDEWEVAYRLIVDAVVTFVPS